MDIYIMLSVEMLVCWQWRHEVGFFFSLSPVFLSPVSCLDRSSHQDHTSTDLLLLYFWTQGAAQVFVSLCLSDKKGLGVRWRVTAMFFQLTLSSPCFMSFANCPRTASSSSSMLLLLLVLVVLGTHAVMMPVEPAGVLAVRNITSSGCNASQAECRWSMSEEKCVTKNVCKLKCNGRDDFPSQQVGTYHLKV